MIEFGRYLKNGVRAGIGVRLVLRAANAGAPSWYWAVA